MPLASAISNIGAAWLLLRRLVRKLTTGENGWLQALQVGLKSLAQLFVGRGAVEYAFKGTTVLNRAAKVLLTLVVSWRKHCHLDAQQTILRQLRLPLPAQTDNQGQHSHFVKVCVPAPGQCRATVRAVIRPQPT